jgi:hypothetical protein
MGSKVLRAIESLEFWLLHAVPCGECSNANPTNICEIQRSVLSCIHHSCLCSASSSVRQVLLNCRSGSSPLTARNSICSAVRFGCG